MPSKREQFRQQVVKSVESDFVAAEDGYFYWFPSPGGMMSEEALRVVADELQKRNAKWDAQVQRECGR